MPRSPAYRQAGQWIPARLLSVEAGSDGFLNRKSEILPKGLLWRIPLRGTAYLKDFKIPMWVGSKTFPEKFVYHSPVGSWKQNLLPLPNILSTQIFPLFLSINSLQRISPSPEPLF